MPEETPRPLLYDVWNDPHALHSFHEERSDLVEKYTAFLEAQLAEHPALAEGCPASLYQLMYQF